MIGKYKKVLFASKVNGCHYLNKLYMNMLVRLFYSWLEIGIILFLYFCLFVAIIDKSLYIIDEFDIILCKIFFQYNEIWVAEFLLL